MKKLFLFISIITIAFAACKKDDDTSSSSSTTTGTTITASDFGNAGDTMLLNVDTTDLTGFSLGTPGQNVTWDFSNLGVDRVDTQAFLTPSTTPGGTYFTTSNLAIQPESGQPIYMYLLKGTDKVEGIGMWANFQGTEIHANYTDKPIMLKFPMSYNSSYNDTSFLEALVNTTTKINITQKFNCIVDATGTIKLPNNVSFTCIREKRTEITINNVFVQVMGQWITYQTTQDTSYYYSFYAKNQKWDVATVRVDNFNANTINEISYKK
jgi:hypothetical protein